MKNLKAIEKDKRRPTKSHTPCALRSYNIFDPPKNGPMLDETLDSKNTKNAQKTPNNLIKSFNLKEKDPEIFDISNILGKTLKNKSPNKRIRVKSRYISQRKTSLWAAFKPSQHPSPQPQSPTSILKNLQLKQKLQPSLAWSDPKTLYSSLTSTQNRDSPKSPFTGLRNNRYRGAAFVDKPIVTCALRF
ncbi:unnamed protein product [Moneuplotes crassus]|uniref:Uncharacterized protein n=1 Tax=Euplotes crassus TaxID=5936 RepID=A0AAD1U4H4_EUPCR|nr:unnamed protein product [Moneuplotes crassus]